MVIPFTKCFAYVQSTRDICRMGFVAVVCERGAGKVSDSLVDWKGLLPGDALESAALRTMGKWPQGLRRKVQRKERVLKASSSGA